ncbi:MAG: transcription initiation factor IIB [Candidatus Jordarchaeales archaeon]
MTTQTPQPPQQPQTCPDCGSTTFIQDAHRGELTCAECGLVIHHHIIDTGPEWRAFSNEERLKRSRVGSPTSLTIHDKGLSTIIDWRDRDIHGKKLAPKRRAQVYRLRKWQIRTRVHSATDRNLAYAMSELERIASQIAIPAPVKQTAANLYRKIIKKSLIRGRSIEAMIAATIYGACRIRKIPRTLDEIAKHSHVNKKELGRCYRLVLKELQIKIPVTDPKDFIPRFSNELHLPPKVQTLATQIIEQAKKTGITAGKDPTGLAAAALYIAAILEGERRTQREISEVAEVTEVTVRNRYKELVKKLNLNVEI